MRRGAAGTVLVVTGALLLAGCGLRLSASTTPAPAPLASSAPAPAAVPAATPALTPAELDATAVPVTPAPMGSAPAAVAPDPSASAPPDAAAVAPASETGALMPSEIVPAPVPRPASSTPPAVAAAARRVAAARAVKSVLTEFDTAAQSMVARSGVPGAAVAVVAGDTAVYVRCFGVRRADASEPVDLGTVFPLGGVSESLTSTMLASLVGSGRLSWDTPVHTYWPGFGLWDPWVSDHATLRDLLAMRTGLPAHAGDELLAFGYGRAEVLRRLRYLGPAAGFRAAFAEQEALPTAAAVAAEHATGSSWASLMRTRVLEPLGMSSTLLSSAASAAAPDVAAPNISVDGVMQAQAPRDRDVLAPALGVSSSIGDLVPFVRMQLGGGAADGVQVADAGALAETQAPATAAGADDQGPVAAGLGWDVSSYNGVRVVAKAGDVTGGSSALVSMAPVDGVGIIVLANSYPEGHVLAASLAATLYDLYILGAAREDWLAAGGPSTAAAGAASGSSPGRSGSVWQQPRVLPEVPPADAAPPRSRSAYAGVYTQRYYGRISVSRGVGDTLRVRLGRGATIVYRPWSGDTWRDPVTGTAAEFTVAQGRAVKVRIGLLGFGGRDAAFTR